MNRDDIIRMAREAGFAYSWSEAAGEALSGEAVKHIKTWNERCEEHPDHQTGMISERMIQERMQEEIDELRQALETEQEPVAWGIFHFGGKRDRKLYTTCDTREQAIAYIADRHQSDDTNTFRAAPIYTSPPAKRKPLTDEEIDRIIASNVTITDQNLHGAVYMAMRELEERYLK